MGRLQSPHFHHQTSGVSHCSPGTPGKSLSGVRKIGAILCNNAKMLFAIFTLRCRKESFGEAMISDAIILLAHGMCDCLLLGFKILTHEGGLRYN